MQRWIGRRRRRRMRAGITSKLSFFGRPMARNLRYPPNENVQGVAREPRSRDLSGPLRSESHVPRVVLSFVVLVESHGVPVGERHLGKAWVAGELADERSEEHTSELQSRPH